MIDALQAPIDRLDTPGQTQILRKTQHRPGFLAGDHPSPLVGVQLVRPRLRLRALQPDTSHTTATTGQLSSKTKQQSAPGSTTHNPPGPGQCALLTRPALMGAGLCQVRPDPPTNCSNRAVAVSLSRGVVGSRACPPAMRARGSSSSRQVWRASRSPGRLSVLRSIADGEAAL
jgi:hypothetical protein